jgi:hypothetical protein
MNDNGYIYVLINPSMENLVKIGKSTRDPQDRAKELSSTTGVPTPFVVVYDYYFESCTKAEQYVHTYLENKGYRVSKSREFFEITVKDAVDAVMKARNHFGEFIPKEINIVDEEGIFSPENEDDSLDNMNYVEKPIEPWEEMFEIAEIHYYGLGDEIVDYEEAMHYYLQAIKLGSIESYCKVGKMYRYGEGVREDNNKAFQYFKEGAKKGDNECFADMAELFADQENIENSLKCWKKYFELALTDIDYLHGQNYISFVYNNNLKLGYIPKLLAVKNQILEFLSDGIERSYGTENEIIIPIYEELIIYIDSNIVSISEKFEEKEIINSNIVNTSEKPEEKEIIKPKSWKNLFR